MSIPDDDDMNCSDQNYKYIIVALADDDDRGMSAVGRKNCTRSRTDCCLSTGIVAQVPKWTTVVSGDRKAV